MHMYMNVCMYVYKCTYIYVHFNTRVSYSVNKRASQSFAHGNRDEADRPETKSLPGATVSPLTQLRYHHILEL